MKRYYQTSISDVVLVARRNIVPCERLLKEIEDCYLKEVATVASESPSDDEEEDPAQEEVRTRAVIEKLPAVINVPTKIYADVEHDNEPALSSNSMVSTTVIVIFY